MPELRDRLGGLSRTQELAKSVLTVLAVTAILVVLITPAPDELPCLAHKHLICKAAVLSRAQLWLSVAIVSNVAPGYRMPPFPRLPDLLSLTCTRLC
jgi:type III secretory pathway component EscU